MAKGGYIGGSTFIRPTEDGTFWDGVDAAARAPSPKRPRRPPDRRPTAAQIRSEEKREQERDKQSQADQMRVVRAFISMCVTAYTKNELSASSPKAPGAISKSVARAGGNVAWLGADRSRQVLFHEAYCRFRGERVEFSRVWGPPKP